MTCDKVEALIKQALGFDEVRGDTIQVAEAKLLTAAPPQTAPSESPTEQPQEWWANPQVVMLVRYGPWVIAVLAFLVFGWMRMRAINPTPTPPAERERVAERLAEAAHRDPEALARAITALMEQS